MFLNDGPTAEERENGHPMILHLSRKRTKQRMQRRNSIGFYERVMQTMDHFTVAFPRFYIEQKVC